MQARRLAGIAIAALALIAVFVPQAEAKVKRVPVKVEWTSFDPEIEVAFGRVASDVKACRRNRAVEFMSTFGSEPLTTDGDGKFSAGGPIFMKPTGETPMRASVAKKTVGKGKRRRICKADAALLEVEVPSEQATLAYDGDDQAFEGTFSAGEGCPTTRAFELSHADGASLPETLAEGTMTNGTFSHPYPLPLSAGDYGLLMSRAGRETVASNGDMTVRICHGGFSNNVTVQSAATMLTTGAGDTGGISAGLNSETQAECENGREVLLVREDPSGDEQVEQVFTGPDSSTASFAFPDEGGDYRVDVPVGILTTGDGVSFVRCEAASADLVLGRIPTTLAVGNNGVTALGVEVNPDDPGPCRSSRQLSLVRVTGSGDVEVDEETTDEFTQDANMSNELAAGSYRIDAAVRVISTAEGLTLCEAGSKAFTVAPDPGSATITLAYSQHGDPEQPTQTFSGDLSSTTTGCDDQREIEIWYTDTQEEPFVAFRMTSNATGVFSHDTFSSDQGFYWSKPEPRVVTHNGVLVSCARPESAQVPNF